MCGERGFRRTRRTVDAGSSPRVWGTGLEHGYMVSNARFIPTCVGNGWSCRCRPPPQRFIPTCVGNGFGFRCAPPQRPVHPHVCGERCHDLDHLDHGYGSSPRVWGTEDSPMPRHPLGRFIPTCVGNGRKEDPEGSQGTVHPHVCGERAPEALAAPGSPGSSPRVWGTVQVI